MINLKTSLLGDMYYLTLITFPILQRKAFLILNLRNTRTTIKKAFLDILILEKVILLNIAPFQKICMNSVIRYIRDLLFSINMNKNPAELV